MTRVSAHMGFIVVRMPAWCSGSSAVVRQEIETLFTNVVACHF